MVVVVMMTGFLIWVLAIMRNKLMQKTTPISSAEEEKLVPKAEVKTSTTSSKIKKRQQMLGLDAIFTNKPKRKTAPIRSTEEKLEVETSTTFQHLTLSRPALPRRKSPRRKKAKTSNEI